MINRTLVRTKVIQTLFAFYNNEGTTQLSAQKELLKLFSYTYSLYFLLLDLVNEITHYANIRIEEAQEKATAMHITYNANMRFVENRVAKQIDEHREIRAYIQDQKLSWETADTYIALFYKQIIDAPFYKEYMEAEENDYEADKALWCKIFKKILTGNSDLESALEELEINLDGKDWVTDMDVIISFVIKTIKRFKENADNEEDTDEAQPLLQMFDSEEELDFGKRLLKTTIENSDYYDELIAKSLTNWKSERIAYMDNIILRTALGEIFAFPEISIQVTLNEYIELAREYSTEQSPYFVNGVLDEIVKQLKQENKLLKAVIIK
ncbi:MAG: transcription antitermination factor NusB [Bacteroidales bacterium]|nr:transcription antitermination factor NusB [Bacteroidales bacterium]